MSRRHRKANRTIRIGTRGSPLALYQAREVAGLLREHDPSVRVIEKIIKTSGDKFQKISKTKIHEYSGKGLFVKELEEALLTDKIDIAVHSLKDVPARLPVGLLLLAYLKREDPFDVFISSKYKNLKDLPRGASLGSSSPRRVSQALAERPDLKIIPLRGNVGTRIKKVEEGVCDATILAAAGLRRLEYPSNFGVPLKHFVPAIGQGIICIESSDLDKDRNIFLRRALNNPDAETAAMAERAFLKTIGGDCHTPIAAHARITRGRIVLAGFVASPAGGKKIEMKMNGTDATLLGERMGRLFVRRGARDILGLSCSAPRSVLLTCLEGNGLIGKMNFAGAEVIRLPLIEITGPSDDYRGLSRAIFNIHQYDWVVFTSKNAVLNFFERLERAPLDPPARGELARGGRFKIAAVGEATAKAVIEHGLGVDLLPKRDQSADGLAREFSRIDMEGKRVLFPRAEEGRDTLISELSRQNAKVDLVFAYQTRPAKFDVAKWKKRFLKQQPDVVVFASPSAVGACVAAFGREFLIRSKIACVGKTTRAALEKCGLSAEILKD